MERYANEAKYAKKQHNGYQSAALDAIIVPARCYFATPRLWDWDNIFLPTHATFFCPSRCRFDQRNAVIGFPGSNDAPILELLDAGEKVTCLLQTRRMRKPTGRQPIVRQLT